MSITFSIDVTNKDRKIIKIKGIYTIFISCVSIRLSDDQYTLSQEIYIASPLRVSCNKKIEENNNININYIVFIVSVVDLTDL